MTDTPDTPPDDEPDDERPDDGPPAPADPAAPDGDDLAELREAVRDLHMLVAAQHAADVHGLTKMLGSKRRLVFVNLLTGLSRGVGFFLGATLIGALLIGGTALFVDAAAETLGLKDMSTSRMVSALYGKFREIKDVIDGLERREDTREATEDAADDKAATDLGR